MNPGLRYLLARGPSVMWRQLRRRFSGGRGVAMLIGIALLLVLIVGPQILRWMELREVGRDRELAEIIRAVGPAGLVVLVLATAMQGGIYFRPAEIQFLFPAPIGRRELLVYDALSKFRMQIVSGLWVSIFVIAYAELWYAAIVAVTLALALLQLSGQALGLALMALAQRFGQTVRRIASLAIWALLGTAMGYAVLGAADGIGFVGIAERFANYPPIALLAFLTAPPVEVLLAEDLAGLALWSVVTLAILGSLVALVTVLDVAWSESTLERAAKVQARLQRVRSGGGAFAAARPGLRGLRIPSLPYWAGVGPVAWRQLQELARNYRSVLMFGVTMLLFVGIFLFMPNMMGAADEQRPEVPAVIPLIMLAIVMPMMTTNGAFDFRRDLDRMALLKTYPVAGPALAFGQVLPTALLVTFWELVALVVLALTLGQIGPWLAIAIALVLLPLNLALIAVDNILFLKLPYRIVASDPGRMPFMPRVMLVMFLKMLILFLLAGLTAIAVGIAWVITRSAPVAAVMAVAVLSMVALGAIYGVSAAFRSFDVSRDIPD